MCRQGPRRWDHFGLVESDDRFSQRVIVRVADAAHRRLDAGFGQSLGVANRQMLATPVAVMHDPLDSGTRPQRLLQRVQDQFGMHRARHPPADDAPGEYIDHERDVNEAGPRRDIRNPFQPSLLHRLRSMRDRFTSSGQTSNCGHPLQPRNDQLTRPRQHQRVIAYLGIHSTVPASALAAPQIPIARPRSEPRRIASRFPPLRFAQHRTCPYTTLAAVRYRTNLNTSSHPARSPIAAFDGVSIPEQSPKALRALSKNPTTESVFFH